VLKETQAISCEARPLGLVAASAPGGHRNLQTEIGEMRRRNILICCTLWLAASAPGTSYAQGVKIVGLGSSSCAQFLTDIKDDVPAEREYFAWVQGYMSGVLLRAPAGKDEDLDLMPKNFPLVKQAAFLRNFCTNYTGADFTEAVNELYKTLRTPPG
jgi:hypothetical protein